MDDSAPAAQAMMGSLSDERQSWRDPMAPFRDLCRAQADALAARDDDVFCVEYRF